MTKQSTNSQLNSSDFFDGWIDHPWVEWLLSNKQYLIWGCAALFATLLLAYRLLATHTSHAEKDFFRAQTNFLQLQQTAKAASQDGSFEPSPLNELENLMTHHPELHAKYDGALAQMMLIEGRIPQAKAFAHSTFQRTRPDRLSFYQDYAKASLLIGEGLYADALSQTQQLQEKIDQSNHAEAFGQTLMTFNLIRLAILYQQLNLPQKELATWEALQNRTENHLPGMLATYQLFKTGQTSLNQYIQERKQALVQ